MIKRKPTGSITVNVRQGEAVGIEAIVKKQLATERIVPPHGHEELRKEDCFVVSGRETFAIPRRIFEVFVAFLGAPKLTGRFSIDFRQGNVTGLHISSQGVVTEEFSLIVDSRLTFEEFEALITEVSKYCKACGSLGIQIEF
jgi:hypothetical protein